MAKFLKSLFSSSTVKIKQDKSVEEDIAISVKKGGKPTNPPSQNKDFTPPQNTMKKMSISRSGRMKHNLKNRGKLNGELFGNEEDTNNITSLEYRVNKNDFFNDEPVTIPTPDYESSNENISKLEGFNWQSHDVSKTDKIETIKPEKPITQTESHIGDESDSDSDSDDLARFDKDIEQIMKYRESDF